jgi:trypsin
MRKLAPFAAVAALAWTLVVAAQAPAISRGVPDGEGHPMVAALGITTPEGVSRGCGGVLVSETVLVTAGHCVAFRPPGSELRVDFASNASPFDPGWFAPVAAVASPQLLTGPQGEIGFGLSSDIGVVLLEPGKAGGRPVAQLPTRNLLGELDSQHGLAGTLFDLVGYGCQANGSSGGPHRLECGDTERQTASAPFQALRPNWLVLNINVNATGEGGGCVHDSGTPQFLHDSTRIVSVQTGGGGPCRATNFDARLDTDTAREFLGQYVALP